MRIKHERWLRILLRVMGVVTFSAVFAVFMPYEWMAAIHARLGMGELPADPIVGYLARSVPAFYAFYGALAIFLSFDLERMLPVVRFMGFASILMGLLLTGVDFAEQLPARWAFFEGPFDIALGTAILWLSRTVPQDVAE